MSTTNGPIVNQKVLQRMMYLYAAVMEGWQIRLLPVADTNGKEQFEFMRNHLKEAGRENHSSRENLTSHSTPTYQEEHSQSAS